LVFWAGCRDKGHPAGRVPKNHKSWGRKGNAPPPSERREKPSRSISDGKIGKKERLKHQAALTEA